MRPTSVSKPVPDPEAAAAGAEVAVEYPEPLPGDPGAATAELSRSAKYLLVRGRREGSLRQPVAGVETVIGSDQRVRIFDTELSPWRRICALSIESPNGQFKGTGWFAGPRTIITAGHCVFHSAQMGGWASRFVVTPGRNGDTSPFGAVTAARCSSLDLWVEAANPDFDIGAIHLEEALGAEVGWFSVAAVPPAELDGYLVNISGYPSNPGLGTQQWFHANRVLSVTGRRIFYDVDTFGGQSGSPVWIHDRAGGDPVVVGVHAYGVGGTPADLALTANSAPRIDPDVMQVIRSWVEGDTAGETSSAPMSGGGDATVQLRAQIRRLREEIQELQAAE